MTARGATSNGHWKIHIGGLVRSGGRRYGGGMKKLLAECFGTFCLVFAGTGAVIVNELNGGVISHAGVALTFGLVVMAMIHAVGDVSGAHLNPAVTLGFYAARRIPGSQVLPYVGSQAVGALLASGLLKVLFPLSATLGATLPKGGAGQAWVLEVVLTLMLMFTILSVSHGPKEKGLTAALAIGGVVALEAMFGGPVSGASMNPARSLGPALVSGQVADLWIYLTAPVVGALLAVPLCGCIRESGCCGRKPAVAC